MIFLFLYLDFILNNTSIIERSEISKHWNINRTIKSHEEEKLSKWKSEWHFFIPFIKCNKIVLDVSAHVCDN